MDVKTSYRTVLFGAVVFVCAAAPAIADSVPAVPAPVKQASAVRSPMDSVPAVPKRSVVVAPPNRAPVPVNATGGGFQWVTATPFLSAFFALFGIHS